MIHASKELIEAMTGAEPFVSVATGWLNKMDGARACGVDRVDIAVWAVDDLREDSRVVDCPACLALMEEARGPERTIALLIHADEKLMGTETGGATLKDREAA